MVTASLPFRPSIVARGAAITGLALALAACAPDATTAPAADTAQVAAVALAQGQAKGQGQCLPDSKLVGLTRLSTADEPGTWWYITREGLDAAGITDQLGFMRQVFGQDFADLDEAIAFVVAAIAPFDENGNGYVCAYESRGTRAALRLPDVSLYTFIVLDDRIGD